MRTGHNLLDAVISVRDITSLPIIYYIALIVPIIPPRPIYIIESIGSRSLMPSKRKL